MRASIYNCDDLNCMFSLQVGLYKLLIYKASYFTYRPIDLLSIACLNNVAGYGYRSDILCSWFYVFL